MKTSPLPTPALNYKPYTATQSPVMYSKSQPTRNMTARNCHLLVYRLMDAPSPSVSPSAATAKTVKLYGVPGVNPVISVSVIFDVSLLMESPFLTSILYV